MSLRNTTSSYGAVTKLFHWVTILLVISLLIVGFIMTGMSNSPDKLKLIGLHKAAGITVLGLATLWLVWRTVNLYPSLPETVTPWQKRGASAAKYVLLALIFCIPLSGWGISSAAGYPVSYFGLFTLPNITAPDKELQHNLAEIHELLAYVLIAVMTLHGSAALLHHFYYKDTVLRRMLPFGNSNERSHVQDSDIHTGC